MFVLLCQMERVRWTDGYCLLTENLIQMNLFYRYQIVSGSQIVCIFKNCYSNRPGVKLRHADNVLLLIIKVQINAVYDQLC